MTPDHNSTEESRKGKETAAGSSSTDRGTIIEIEGQHGGGRRKITRKAECSEEDMFRTADPGKEVERQAPG